MLIFNVQVTCMLWIVLEFEFEVWIIANGCLRYGFKLSYFFIIYGLVVIKV